ncbi:MAG: response regulator, partial [Chloroflexota bacterium]
LNVQPASRLDSQSSETTYPIRFEIEDTGIGMSEDDISRIFMPFEQVETSDLDHSGTGLGLAIATELVSLMGGELQASSEKGIGSCFWFELNLPLVFPVEETSNIPVSHQVRQGYFGEQRLILIVDDEADNRGLLSELLTPLGFNILEASGGADALTVLESYTPDLIIIDKVMPGLSGLETITRIRAIHKFANLPIIGTSANIFTDTEADMFQDECQAFLPKPFDFEQLLHLLEEHLELTWLYETETQRQTSMNVSTAQLILPPETILRELYTLIDTGHIRKAEKQITDLQVIHPEYGLFLYELNELTAQFEEDEAKALINRYLNPSN